MVIIRLDCDFIITPRIVFNDKNLSRTDIFVLSLIISLTLKSNYCYASNNYLATYINTSIRTISDSLSKLKKLNYIIIKYDNSNRKIYLNTEKVPMKSAGRVEEFCSDELEDSCYHNINNKYKKEYINKLNKFKREGTVQKWIENPELCKEDPASSEEIEQIEKLFKKFK